MSQNLISLAFTDADYAEIDSALRTLEQKLVGLIDLTIDERRSLTKMGDKSEAFCRQTLSVLAENPGLLPPDFDMAEAQRDLRHFDALRSSFNRLSMLLGRVEDARTALGSDVMSAALEGYALLKVMGRGAGLESLRQGVSARFSHSGSSTKASAAAS